MPPPGSRVRRLAARGIYEAGTIAGRWPSVALPVARWRGHGEPLDARTDLVVEGFPRSSNSLTVALLAAAQPGEIRIAHHVHAPAHVIEAVHRRLPTLVLVREPSEAVVELVLLKPALSVRQVLRGWVRFHAPLVPRRRGFVVASSSEVPEGLDDVVRRLNERFGTSFFPPDVSGNLVASAEAAMTEYWEGRSGPGLPLVGRTSERETDRERDRERLQRACAAQALASLREGAERLHRSFTSGPPHLGGSAGGRL
ncbi:MAG TPA: hypothetical protein VF984_11525 [Actinomycetota bacterium]